MYTCNLESMENKIKTFSKFGDAGHGGITRYSLSKEAIMARKEFQKRMENIGAVMRLMIWPICMQRFREPMQRHRGL